jgi:hypothetical protein
MNRFLVAAAAEKVPALQTEAYFTERRARADREAFMRTLNREGGAEPDQEDALPEDRIAARD